MKRRGTFDRLSAGEISLLLAAAIVIAGVGGFIALKPLFSGDKRRAKASQEATAALVVAVDNQAASAAASVATIGVANSMAPESPSKAFIGREVPAALAKLPAPDPAALLEAEKRRAAVMEGRLEEASRLYERESERASRLQQERDTAIAERRAVDLELSEAAARAAAEQQRLIIGAVAALAAGVAVWLRLTHGAALREMVAGVAKAKEDHPDRIDGVLAAVSRQMSPRSKKLVRKLDAEVRP